MADGALACTGQTVQFAASWFGTLHDMHALAAAGFQKRFQTQLRQEGVNRIGTVQLFIVRSSSSRKS